MQLVSFTQSPVDNFWVTTSLFQKQRILRALQLVIDVRRNVADGVVQGGGAVLKRLLDLFEAMHDRRVVAVKFAADLGKRQVCHRTD